jgi:hypothetical protein
VWQRVRFHFREKYWWVVLFFGVVFTLVGWCLSPTHPTVGSALVGIGTSMLATMLVSFAGPDGDETYRNFLGLGVRGFYASRNKVANDLWVEWLEGAQRHCILFGIANGEWTRDEGFEPALASRLIAKVQIQVFFLDPNSPEADVREKEDQQKLELRGRIRASIRKLWEMRSRLNDDAKGRLSVYTYRATPSLGVTWIDDWMLVTHYLAGSNNLTSPALRVESIPKKGSPYAVYRKNVEEIREKFSTEVTDDNVKTYTDEPSNKP